MSLKEEIQKKLGTYFDEMNRCEKGGCYWALLHLAVVLPDICGALEADDGEAKPERYQDWCGRHLADERLTGLEWYGIRCTVLHQGRTLARPGKRYGSYCFEYPGGRHKIPYPPNDPARWPDGQDHLSLDVGKMAEEVMVAVDKWIAYLAQEDPEAVRRAKNVKKNLWTVAKMGKPSDGKPPRYTSGDTGAAFFTSAPTFPLAGLILPPPDQEEP
jgi:hypothetical protein